MVRFSAVVYEEQSGSKITNCLKEDNNNVLCWKPNRISGR